MAVGPQRPRPLDQQPGEQLGHARLLQRLADAERRGDGDQHRQVDRLPRLGGRDAAGQDHRAGGQQGGQHDVDLAADERRDHGEEDDRGEPGPVVADGAGVLDVADQVEVGVVAEGPAEVRPDLEQERVAGVQPDVADLVGQPGAVAVHGDDGRVVELAEVGVAHRLADQRRAGADHRLAELPAALHDRRDLVARVGRRHQARDLLQVDDRADHAR